MPETPYDEDLEDLIASLQRPNLTWRIGKAILTVLWWALCFVIVTPVLVMMFFLAPPLLGICAVIAVAFAGYALVAVGVSALIGQPLD